jgi:hypothetical protein
MSSVVLFICFSHKTRNTLHPLTLMLLTFSFLIRTLFRSQQQASNPRSHSQRKNINNNAQCNAFTHTYTDSDSVAAAVINSRLCTTRKETEKMSEIGCVCEIFITNFSQCSYLHDEKLLLLLPDLRCINSRYKSEQSNQ